MDYGADDRGGVGLDVDGAGVGGGELQGVEDGGGAAGVDAVAGEGGDDEGDGDLNGFGVFEGREIQLDFGRDLGRLQAGLRGIGCGFRQVSVVFDQISVAAVETRVEVAERSLAQGWGFAAMAVGFDVAAESLGHVLLLFYGGDPPPFGGGYFAGKLIVCYGLARQYVAKILILLCLPAKYRQA